MTALPRPFTGDPLGIINSALCIVHCLAMPLLVAIGASFLEHRAVGYVFVVLAGVAVLSAVRHRNRPLVAALLGVGLALFAVGIVLEGAYHELEVLTYAGSAVLIVGHLLNWRR